MGTTPNVSSVNAKTLTETDCAARVQEGWLTGFEPATPGITIRRNVVASGKAKRVTASPSANCTSVCTSDGKTGHGNGSEPASDDGFAAAVQAIMRLPLSDAEKAEAVRRLLAGR